MQQTREGTFWDNIVSPLNSSLTLPPLKMESSIQQDENAPRDPQSSLFMTYDRLHGVKLMDEKLEKQSKTERQMELLTGG